MISEGLLVRAAECLRVLGQPVRLRIIEQLDEGEVTPQELADLLGLTQQNVSKHLQVLHRAGVVDRRRAGANVWYRLLDDTASVMLEMIVARESARLRDLSRAAGLESLDPGLEAPG